MNLVIPTHGMDFKEKSVSSIVDPAEPLYLINDCSMNILSSLLFSVVIIDLCKLEHVEELESFAFDLL